MVEKIVRKWNILHAIINYTQTQGFAPKPQAFREGPYAIQGRDGNVRLIRECIRIHLIQNVETIDPPHVHHPGNDTTTGNGLQVTPRGRIFHDNIRNAHCPLDAKGVIFDIITQLVPLQDEDPEENNEN